MSLLTVVGFRDVRVFFASRSELNKNRKKEGRKENKTKGNKRKQSKTKTKTSFSGKFNFKKLNLC